MFFLPACRPSMLFPGALAPFEQSSNSLPLTPPSRGETMVEARNLPPLLAVLRISGFPVRG